MLQSNLLSFQFPNATIRFSAVASSMHARTLSSLAGLDRAYYGGIERGERNVAALNLIKMAVALDVEVGNLFPKLTELTHK
jgi:transcriptional regulator with XRE-family HTH domain